MQVTRDFRPFRGKFLGRYGSIAITPLWTHSCYHHLGYDLRAGTAVSRLPT